MKGFTQNNPKGCVNSKKGGKNGINKFLGLIEK